jgi:hypothetical protein
MADGTTLWLLAAGASPFHGGASSHSVEAERLAFQANLQAIFRIQCDSVMNLTAFVMWIKAFLCGCLDGTST